MSEQTPTDNLELEQTKGREGNSRIEDVEKAHYMANRGALAMDKYIRTSGYMSGFDRAHSKRIEQKIKLYEVTKPLEMLGLFYEDYGAVNIAELAIPGLDRLNDKIREKMRTSLANRAIKFEGEANNAFETAAQLYDKTEGHPYLVADVEEARKQATKQTKGQAEREKFLLYEISELEAYLEKLTSKLDTLGVVDEEKTRKAAKRKRLETEINRIRERLNLYK